MAIKDSYHKADRIIKIHVAFSMGAGLVPIPILDAVGVIAVQVDMLRLLCKNYDIPFYEERGKSVVSALVGGSIARMATSSIIKLIPGVGSIIGGITMSAISGASTFAVGQIFKQHFSGGGIFEDLDLEKAKKIYKEEFKKGKEVVEEMEEEKKQAKSGDDVYQKLEKLAELRQKNIITEADFEQQKKRLLDSI